MMIGCLCTSAQEKYYGSEKNGFALSINANPFLNFAGNMFNGTENNSLSDFEGVKNKLFSGVTVTGKYMLKDNFALDLGLGWDNEYETSYSFQDNDIEKRTALNREATTAFMLKVGGEYLLRPGKRLQPVLGADLVYVHENSWDYVDQFENVNGINKYTNYYGAPVNKLGLIANIGVEYFICQNISLSGTVSLGLAKQWNKNSHATDSTKDHGDEYTRYTSNTLVLKTGSTTAGANVALNFYF